MILPGATDFGHLKTHDEQLVRLGLLAERHFADDPNTCLLKLRQLAEALAQLTASRVGVFASQEEKQADLLRRLQDHGILPREVGSLFHELRKAGNDASGGDRSCADWLPLLPPHLSELVASLEGHVLSPGDDVQRKELKLCVASKRLKNFAAVAPQKNRLVLYLHLDPARLVPLPFNGRDVSQQGHWGTGDLALGLDSQEDLDAAKPLILMAYEGRGAIAASLPPSGS